MKLLERNDLVYTSLVDSGFKIASARTGYLVGAGLTRIGYLKNGEKKEILKEASVSIAPGEICAIIGESGSGKTTLLKALCGIEKASQGVVLYDRLDCYGSPEARKLFAYLPQYDLLHPELTVEEELRYIAQLRCPASMTADDIEAKITELIDQLGLFVNQNGEKRSLAQEKIAKLSGGQRRYEQSISEPLCMSSLIIVGRGR